MIVTVAASGRRLYRTQYNAPGSGRGETDLWPNGTVTAANATLAAVQDAVDTAVDGQRVLIPNGTETWSGGISTTKQILIRAQTYTATPAGTEGSGATTRGVNITNNSATPLFDMTSGSTYHVGVAGIRFDDGTGDGAHVSFSGTGTKVPLLSDCYLENRNRFWPTEKTLIVNSLGGVIWNCVWQGTGDVENAGEGSILVKPGAGVRAWTTASTMGDADTNGSINVYFEDFEANRCGNCPDMDDCARVVIRHFVYDGSWGETHGPTSLWGGRHFEVYDGIFKSTESLRNLAARYFWVRGGTGVFTDNAVYDAVDSSSYGHPKQLDVGESNVGPGTYMVDRQPGCGHNGSAYVSDPIYIWSQTESQAYTRGYINGWDAIVVEDRDIYINNGAKPSYTKYEYPHPLRYTKA